LSHLDQHSIQPSRFAMDGNGKIAVILDLVGLVVGNACTFTAQSANQPASEILRVAIENSRKPRSPMPLIDRRERVDAKD
jgi:hypothetical protein